MKSRRPGTKGTEWLLIKHRDAYDQPGYDIDQYDYSVLTKRSMDEIAGDAGSAEWKSRPASRAGTSQKSSWLADSIAKLDARRAKESRQSAAAKTTKSAPAKRLKLNPAPAEDTSKELSKSSPAGAQSSAKKKASRRMKSRSKE
jgi:bifunctional non-homologous end joining protein LigD